MRATSIDSVSANERSPITPSYRYSSLARLSVLRTPGSIDPSGSASTTKSGRKTPSDASTHEENAQPAVSPEHKSIRRHSRRRVQHDPNSTIRRQFFGNTERESFMLLLCREPHDRREKNQRLCRSHSQFHPSRSQNRSPTHSRAKTRSRAARYSVSSRSKTRVGANDYGAHNA